MSKVASTDAKQPGATSHRMFAAYYERLSRGAPEKQFMDPLRKEVTAQAHGLVLEIGAGNGLNFAYYNPENIERVEAMEPDNAMLGYAHERVKAARVPINLTQAPVEGLPFADATFDSAICTLVFCSVTDPLRGLHEIRRVLKPGGTLLMVEHVRAHGRVAATLQDMLTPLTKFFAGNCHWNRDTERTVNEAAFEVIERRDLGGVMVPMVMLRARR